MFVRDPFTTTMTHFQPVTVSTGQALGQYPSGTEQALLKQLHGLAIAIYEAQQRANAAVRRGDVELAHAEIATVGTLQSYFADMNRRWRAASEANDPDAMSAFDNFILKTGTWIEQSLAALPSAVAAVPKAAVDAVSQVIWKLGTGVGIPLALLIVGALALVGRAERTRTFRKYVA